MQIRRGIRVSPGIAIGPAFVIPRERYDHIRRHVSEAEVAVERERFQTVHARLVANLRNQVDELGRRIGPVAGRILEAHVAMLSDSGCQEEILRAISRHRYSAEFAVRRVLQGKMDAIASAGAHSFAQRILQDLRDIESLLMRQLVDPQQAAKPSPDRPVVWVAHDLSPTEVAALDRSRTLGLLLATGGASSHASIVAHTLGIPTVVGVENISAEVADDDTVIVDGTSGTVILDPDEGSLKRYRAMLENLQLSEERLAHDVLDRPAVTRDGVRVTILANIEFPSEIEFALQRGAEGIGLYRTEFLYLAQPEPPDENAHFETYCEALRRLGSRPLVVRTLDLGADKIPGEGLRLEADSRMGTRAIRLCLERRDLFGPQLRALLRAARFGSVSVMFPLITSLAEVREVRGYVDVLRRNLAREGIAHGPSIPMGVMIETPAAALTADLLAGEVDFFSIGTNDLTAFTIAVDRGNEHVCDLFTPAHPAVIRMIRRVLEVGQSTGRPVSLCGEMASDVRFTLLLLGLGLRCFSVVPPAIPEIKKIIRSVSCDEACAIAEKVLTHDSAKATEELLREETSKILPDLV